MTRRTARVSEQIILQPVHGVEIEVVGRLVEKQHGRIAKQCLGQQYANFLAALQLRHFALMQRFVDIEALEQNGGVRFGRITALFADNAFEFAHAHAVFVGPLGGIRVELFALLQGFPQRCVAHDDGVQNAERIEGELILAENADLLRPSNGAFTGLDFAGQNFHERRFAGAIGAGNRVTPSRLKCGGHFVEEDAASEAHGEIIYGYQGEKCVPGDLRIGANPAITLNPSVARVRQGGLQSWESARERSGPLNDFRGSPAPLDHVRVSECRLGPLNDFRGSPAPLDHVRVSECRLGPLNDFRGSPAPLDHVRVSECRLGPLNDFRGSPAPLDHVRVF